MKLEDEASDEEPVGSLFVEPTEYYAPEKAATFTHHTCRSGMSIPLRLVGHSPLWGHLLWNAGKVVADFVEQNADTLIRGKDVLELGAGAGLPSLVCATLGARKVVVTDYPEAKLIENLKYNIDHCPGLPSQTVIVAEGFLWGNTIEPLLAHLGPRRDGFDVLILADILFNHSEHDKLVATVVAALKRRPGTKALVFFTPYRPWLLEKDLRFFEFVQTAGLVVEKTLEHTMDAVMFEQDPGDERLRRTVFGYEVKWP